MGIEPWALKPSGFGGFGGYGDFDGDFDSGYGFGFGGYGFGGYGGYSNDFGSGYGDGNDFDYGTERETMKSMRAYFQSAAEAGTLTTLQALKEENAELRRVMIECLGPDRFFSSAPGMQVIHEDTAANGDRRRLLRVPMEDAEKRYIQAVHVICPTTRREYHLMVSPEVTTCQEAVASTFGLKADEYHPIRES